MNVAICSANELLAALGRMENALAFDLASFPSYGRVGGCIIRTWKRVESASNTKGGFAQLNVQLGYLRYGLVSPTIPIDPVPDPVTPLPSLFCATEE